jgi:twitching motility protein PilT
MNPELEQKFLQLIREAIRENITDIHLTARQYPFIRMTSRDVEPVVAFGVISLEDLFALVEYMAPQVTREHIDSSTRGTNFIYELDGSRFRANVSKDNDGFAIALRTIKKNTPTAEMVWLTPQILKMLHGDRGLILVTWWTWSWKTTTVMAMLDYLNKHTHKHIITVEDPIEYIIKNDKSLIHQKQVGKHVETFDQAIRDAMREDPDIIIVGEMRDQETISAVLTLAETGHLVISTLHTNDVVQAFDRLIYAFPAGMQSQIRIQLALVLVSVIGQIILPKKDGSGNIVAREIFINGDASRNLIMDWNISHLYGVMETWSQEGQVPMQNALINLHKEWKISGKVLMEHIKNPTVLREYINDVREQIEK